MANLPNEKVMDELFRVQEEMSCALQTVVLDAYHSGKREQLIKDMSIVCYRFNVSYDELFQLMHLFAIPEEKQKMKQEVEELVAYYKREFQLGRCEGIVQRVLENMQATGQTVEEVVARLCLRKEDAAMCRYVLEREQDGTVEEAIEAFMRAREEKHD